VRSKLLNFDQLQRLSANSFDFHFHEHDFVFEDYIFFGELCVVFLCLPNLLLQFARLFVILRLVENEVAVSNFERCVFIFESAEFLNNAVRNVIAFVLHSLLTVVTALSLI
jgi:hypothetical protein